MKTYQKPELDIAKITQECNIASLAQWLESASGEEYQNAGITTYVIQS